MVHHASLFLGTFAELCAELPEEFRTPGIDVLHLSYDRFSINDARRMRQEASLRPLAGALRVFVLGFTHAPNEAQNALLKTLEEPALTSRFYIAVPREDALIATVRSRLMRMEPRAAKGESADARAAADAFMRNSLGDRLAIIGEKTKEKDGAWIEALLTGLEGALTANGARTDNAEALRDLIFVRAHVGASGASKKMLLEHLALSLP